MPKESSQSAANMAIETAHAPKKAALPKAAERALAEAQARRRAAEKAQNDPSNAPAKEVGGRKGPDPVRYGDWENGGITSDF